MIAYRISHAKYSKIEGYVAREGQLWALGQREPIIPQMAQTALFNTIATSAHPSPSPRPPPVLAAPANLRIRSTPVRPRGSIKVPRPPSARPDK